MRLVALTAAILLTGASAAFAACGWKTEATVASAEQSQPSSDSSVLLKKGQQTAQAGS